MYTRCRADVSHSQPCLDREKGGRVRHRRKVTDFVGILANGHSYEVVVLPFENDQTNYGIFAICYGLWLFELEEDEGVNAATPGLATVHAGALLAICLPLVLIERRQMLDGGHKVCHVVGGWEEATYNPDLIGEGKGDYLQQQDST